MGLIDDATALATRNQAEADIKRKEQTRAAGVKGAEKFTEQFGLEATYLDTVTDVEYQKRYRDFGGTYWSTTKVTGRRMQVDDLTIRMSDNQLAVYLPCSKCREVRPFKTGHLSNFGTPEQVRERFLQAIGNVLTRERECTHCQAQPCECCGAVR